MAIVSCPNCGNSMSDKNDVCPKCEKNVHEIDVQKTESERRIERLRKGARIQMITYSSMVVFLAGVLFFYFGRQAGNTLQVAIGYGCLGIGGIGYLWSRVSLIMFKKTKLF